MGNKKNINVLFLEDEAGAYYYLVEELEEKGFNVCVATNVSRAKTLWEKIRIDFIIADLNMPPRGLNDAQTIEETSDAKLTGWVYLKKYVYSKKQEMKKRTIILTAYMEELKRRVEEKEYEGIKLVEKRIDEDEMKDIMETLKDMASRLGRRKNG